MKACEGFPKGHECPVQIADDRIWCQGCIRQRQEAEASGLPASGMVRASIVMEDLQAPLPECACGGDLTAPHHLCSLRHMQWVWQTTVAPKAPPRSKRRYGKTEPSNGGLQIPADQVS